MVAGNNGPLQERTFIGNPPKYVRDGMLKQGWVHLGDKNKYISAQVIWTTTDNTGHYKNLHKKQAYNHI